MQLPRSTKPGRHSRVCAGSNAYFDVFLMLTVLTLGLVPSCF
jgi:hypothetical protein